MFYRNGIPWLRRLLLALSLYFIPLDHLQAAPQEVYLVTSAYPPYFGPELPNGGVITEIVREAFRRSGYTAKLEFLPWARCLAYAKSGKVDGLFGVWHLKERESFLLYADPMPPIQLGFYTRANSKIQYKTFEDLRPYVIGTVQSYGDPPNFVAAKLNTDVAPDDKRNLAKLQAGRVDLILIEKGVARYLLTHEFPTMLDELVWIDPPVSTNLQYVALSLATQRAKELQQAFRAG
ncbi:substrate-binding periplasmic protein [Chitinimonas sp. PSY-7]|uniref:substrate-binding periplasmic protein n=1 Tax=Chitinimonas sp. PSY-7 TaxID=3459088 RepID=UPI00404012B7